VRPLGGARATNALAVVLLALLAVEMLRTFDLSTYLSVHVFLGPVATAARVRSVQAARRP
jgi:hypothetical protein